MYPQHKYRLSVFIFTLLGALPAPPAFAHDPVFALGPHVLFKGGVEITPEVFINQAGDDKLTKTALELTYGITGDWAAGIDIPYVDKSTNNASENGQGDLQLFTKYRFWRKDGPGVQQSMTVAVKVKTDTGDNKVSSGTTDTLLGLAYGYESRKWYRWAALRYLLNGENDIGQRRGDKVFYDLVGGVRLQQTSYLEPDTVWLLELNGEYSERNELNGGALTNSGGNEIFLSPGIFWTLRNFAIKAGVQLPVLNQLNEGQKKTDYRAKLVLEWHL